MTRSTMDPDVYRDRWTDHIDQLDRLRSALPDELHDDLEAHQDGLRDLVDEAAAAATGQEGED